MPSESLRESVVAAYGGAARWRAAEVVEAGVAVRGPLIEQRRGLTYPGLAVTAQVHRPSIRLAGFEDPGVVAVLDGHDVRTETVAGEPLDARPGARDYFPDQGDREQRWDTLDMAYFLGYALWNYLTLPALLLRADVEWRELSATTLEGRFPPEVPTHCEVQEYDFDAGTSLLRAYRYTAEVFGAWAKADHLVDEHSEAGGVPFPSRRRVLARGAGAVVIELEVDQYRLA